MAIRAQSRPQAPGTTLTQITYFSRIGIIWSLIVIIVLLMGKLGYDGFLNFLSNEKCKQPEIVNRTAGKLPPLNLPAQSSYQKPTAYFLQLKNPQADMLPTQIPETPLKLTTQRVYAAQNPVSGIAADKRVREMALAFGFKDDPEIIDAELYRWQQGNDIFEINRRTLHFDYHTNYQGNAEYLHTTGKSLPTSAQATKMIKDELIKINLLPDDMASMAAEVNYMKAVGNELVKANTTAEADFIQIVLKREPVKQTKGDDRCRPVTQKYEFALSAGQVSPIVGIVGRNWTDQDTIVSLVNNYQDFDYTDYGIYHTRSIASAWESVLGGEAYIAQAGNLSQAIITSIEIGYFADTKEQSFLQPIYIFNGEGNFKAYVPAIDPSEIDANWNLLNKNDAGSNNLAIPTVNQTASSGGVVKK